MQSVPDRYVILTDLKGGHFRNTVFNINLSLRWFVEIGVSRNLA